MGSTHADARPRAYPRVHGMRGVTATLVGMRCGAGSAAQTPTPQVLCMHGKRHEPAAPMAWVYMVSRCSTVSRTQAPGPGWVCMAFSPMHCNPKAKRPAGCGRPPGNAARAPFSSISICWIFRLFRILMATLCPVRVCSATLTCKAQPLWGVASQRSLRCTDVRCGKRHGTKMQSHVAIRIRVCLAAASPCQTSQCPGSSQGDSWPNNRMCQRWDRALELLQAAVLVVLHSWQGLLALLALAPALGCSWRG